MVCVIEESNDVTILSIDELHTSLLVQEARINAHKRKMRSKLKRCLTQTEVMDVVGVVRDQEGVEEEDKIKTCWMLQTSQKQWETIIHLFLPCDCLSISSSPKFFLSPTNFDLILSVWWFTKKENNVERIKDGVAELCFGRWCLKLLWTEKSEWK